MKEIFPDPDPTCSSIGYMSPYYLSKAYITNNIFDKYKLRLISHFDLSTQKINPTEVGFFFLLHYTILYVNMNNIVQLHIIIFVYV